MPERDDQSASTDAELLQRVDAYLHAVPLSGAEDEEVGPFTLFRSAIAWPYYARPRPGGADAITAADVERVRDRCLELEIPISIEWVVDTAPTVSRAAADAGLAVREHPLLVLERGDLRPQSPPPDVVVEVLPADAGPLIAARAVAEVGFSNPPTAHDQAGLDQPRRDLPGLELPGPEARDAQVSDIDAVLVATLVTRTENGVMVTVGATSPERGMLASGAHQPVGSASEIVGVATLPSERRRGLGAAVATALAEDAFGRGVSLVLLSAQDDAVARVYERIGFRRIGAVGAAEPSV